MIRLAWFMVAVVLGLVGLDLLVRSWLGWTGWFLAGVGIGIGCAVIGSVLHDALSGVRRQP